VPCFQVILSEHNPALALGIIFQFYTLALIAGISFDGFRWLRLSARWMAHQARILADEDSGPKGQCDLGRRRYGPLRLKKHASP
jgi:hypothetical protein